MSTVNDSELGSKIAEYLSRLGLETPLVKSSVDDVQKFAAMADAQTSIMTALDLDLKDDSLQDTPRRVAKMYREEVFYGLDYKRFPKCTVIQNTMNYDELVSVCKIDVLSMCEHHFVPFIGQAHIAYIPKDIVIGLSKFNRIVDFFSRRPQVQERLTGQIAATLQYILQTQDVAVVINAQHLCVKLRGVKASNSSTSTSKMSGRFLTNDALRAEFFSIINSEQRNG